MQDNENIEYKPLYYYILSGLYILTSIAIIPFFLEEYTYITFITNMILCIGSLIIGYTRENAIKYNYRRINQSIFEFLISFIGLFICGTINMIEYFYLTGHIAFLIIASVYIFVSLIYFIGFCITINNKYSQKEVLEQNRRNRSNLQLFSNFISKELIEKAIIDKKECPIDHQAININNSAVLSPCGHVFCGTALKTYFENRTTCPVCRIETVPVYFINNTIIEKQIHENNLDEHDDDLEEHDDDLEEHVDDLEEHVDDLEEHMQKKYTGN